MGITPLSGRGLDTNLAWVQDTLGPDGAWLVVTTIRRTLHAGAHQQVVRGLVPHLAAVTASARRYGTEVSVEAAGPRVGDDHPGLDDDRPLLELDHVSMTLTDASRPFGDRSRFECWRLPSLWVEPLGGLAEDHWSAEERGLVLQLVAGWSEARRREVGLSPRAEPGLHRRWSRGGHTILVEHVALIARWRAQPFAERPPRSLAVVTPLQDLARTVLMEQQLQLVGEVRTRPGRSR